MELDREGGLNDRGMPAHLIDGAALLTEFREEMRPNDVPAFVQRRVFPLLARMGTLFGRAMPGYPAPISV